MVKLPEDALENIVTRKEYTTTEDPADEMSVWETGDAVTFTALPSEIERTPADALALPKLVKVTEYVNDVLKL